MRYITLFILSLIFWLLLVFKITVPYLIVGSVAALLCTLFFGRFFIKNVYKLLQPQRYFWFIVYLFVFLWECIKANLDVAYRVITMRIRPGIIRVSSDLKSDLGIFMLANSITLTPGTITVDIDEDTHDLYIHNINVGEGDEAKPVIRDHELFSLANLPRWIRRIAE